MDIGSEAAASSRSSNNATTQSWGMLMNRAINDFRDQLNNSPYRHDIRLINTIHDAAYGIVKLDLNVLKYLNDTLVKAMSWQEDPKIQSDEVHLGAELDLGFSWDKQYTMKNGLSIDEIDEFLKEHQLLENKDKDLS